MLCADKAGEFTSKPRPVVVMQNTSYINSKGTVIVCPVSTVLVGVDLVLSLEPSPENGLKLKSVVRADLITTVRKARLGEKIGAINAVDVLRMNEIMRDWLNL